MNDLAFYKNVYFINGWHYKRHNKAAQFAL